jgi:hypothetical protein
MEQALQVKVLKQAVKWENAMVLNHKLNRLMVADKEWDKDKLAEGQCEECVLMDAVVMSKTKKPLNLIFKIREEAFCLFLILYN